VPTIKQAQRQIKQNSTDIQKHQTKQKQYCKKKQYKSIGAKGTNPPKNLGRLI
jgi:hypothetical protein